MAAYEKSRVGLDRATGLALDHLGIEMGEAESGRVQRMPNIPGVAPRSETQSMQSIGAPQVPSQNSQQSAANPQSQTTNPK